MKKTVSAPILAIRLPPDQRIALKGRRSIGVHLGAEDHHELAARAAGKSGVNKRLRTKPSDTSERVNR